MFYLWFRAGSIFDYMAFGLPVFKSDIVGFDNLYLILNQRLFYLMLGLAFVLATVLLFNRLPQSRLHRSLSLAFMIIFLAVAGICGYNTYSAYNNNLTTKNKTIEVNRQFENADFATMTDVSIDFAHHDDSFKASADIRIRNDNQKALDRYIFTLNPSLEVEKITAAGRETDFKRLYQLIEITPANELEPGAYDSLVITYKGKINESFCYPNYKDNIKDNSYRIAMLNVGKRQAFLTRNYILLTPETFWYPSACLNYYPSNPARIKVDFTNFRLRVTEDDGLTAVSQGRSDEEGGYRVFKPEHPLSGLTLAAGNYMTDTLTVDSVSYTELLFSR